MKRCLKCDIEKEEEEFGKTFKNKCKTKFNLRSYCKICDRIINKEYCEKNREILAQKRKERVQKKNQKIGISVQYGFSVVDETEHKRKESCRHKTLLLLKKGIVKKMEFCQICGKNDCRIEVHHADYSKPEWFVSLCRACHMKIHWNVLNER